jgi:hypothetical protein
MRFSIVKKKDPECSRMATDVPQNELIPDVESYVDKKHKNKRHRNGITYLPNLA